MRQPSNPNFPVEKRKRRDRRTHGVMFFKNHQCEMQNLNELIAGRSGIFCEPCFTARTCVTLKQTMPLRKGAHFFDRFVLRGASCVSDGLFSLFPKKRKFVTRLMRTLDVRLQRVPIQSRQADLSRVSKVPTGIVGSVFTRSTKIQKQQQN